MFPKDPLIVFGSIGIFLVKHLIKDAYLLLLLNLNATLTLWVSTSSFYTKILIQYIVEVILLKFTPS